jgi:hypothetical protein
LLEGWQPVVLSYIGHIIDVRHRDVFFAQPFIDFMWENSVTPQDFV